MDKQRNLNEINIYVCYHFPLKLNQIFHLQAGFEGTQRIGCSRSTGDVSDSYPPGSSCSPSDAEIRGALCRSDHHFQDSSFLLRLKTVLDVRGHYPAAEEIVTNQMARWWHDTSVCFSISIITTKFTNLQETFLYSGARVFVKSLPYCICGCIQY